MCIRDRFRTVATKIAERNGGYTRISKTGFRPGDAADTAMIELVDFNELYNPNAEEKKATRRSRRSAAPKKEAVATIPAKEEAKTEEPVADAPKAEAADTTDCLLYTSRCV